MNCCGRPSFILFGRPFLLCTQFTDSLGGPSRAGARQDVHGEQHGTARGTARGTASHTHGFNGKTTVRSEITKRLKAHRPHHGQCGIRGPTVMCLDEKEHTGSTGTQS